MIHQLEKYTLTKTFTPLLNTPDFSLIFGGKEGSLMPFDAQGVIRAFESVLFPQTKVRVLLNKRSIVQIETKEYPYKGPFFTDERFLEKMIPEKMIPERIATLPSLQSILDTMVSVLHFPYIWGGNCLKIPELLSLYPPKETLPETTLAHWTFKGFDCSGLIYYAAKGLVPRNTSSWLSFGQTVPIEGKSLHEILSSLKPLDAVVWKGHIFFILDAFHTIESRIGKGVIITKIQERFEELFQGGFTPRDLWKEGEKQFLIRRWHFESV